MKAFDSNYLFFSQSKIKLEESSNFLQKVCLCFAKISQNNMTSVDGKASIKLESHSPVEFKVERQTHREVLKWG